MAGATPTAAAATLLESPVAGRLAGLAVSWRAVNGYRAAAHIAGTAPGQLSLCDLTHLARAGLKGRGASDWLSEAGFRVPPAPNQIEVDGGGCVVARLGQEDFLLVDAPDGKATCARRLEERWRELARSGRRIGFLTPKQHSHVLFHLGGAAAHEVLARLCAVDLRPRAFGAQALAQTMAAGIVVTIMRYERGTPSGYLLLFDTSLAEYAWDALVDAMTGFDGGVIGFAQLT